jgi:hypothetical protein
VTLIVAGENDDASSVTVFGLVLPPVGGLLFDGDVLNPLSPLPPHAVSANATIGAAIHRH